MEFTNDIIDEALRTIILSNDENSPIGGLKHILNTEYTTKMTDGQKRKMLQALKAKVAPTFGDLLQKTIEINKINLQSFADKIRLPSNLLEQLFNDSIVANEIPVLLMKKILNELQIPVEKAAAAIIKTFEKLSTPQSDSRHSGLFQPSFRKSAKKSSEFGGFTGRNSNELFENEVAINNYLEHLKELM